MNDIVNKWKEACALIDTNRGTGTGYLVNKRLVLTCWHVVEHVNVGEQVTLKFYKINNSLPSNTRIQQMQGIVSKFDPHNDIAIIELASELIDIEPLTISQKGCQNKEEWETHGFPDIELNGVKLDGTVHESSMIMDQERNIEAIALYSEKAKSSKLEGFSGAPVFLNNSVVGHLKKIIPENPTSRTPKKAAFGLIYATKAHTILSFLAEHNLLPKPIKPSLLPQGSGLGYDPNCYIHREEEELLAQERIDRIGGGIVVCGPEQSGKTTFIEYLLKTIKDDNSQKSVIAKLEINNLNNAHTQSIEALLKDFATLLVNAIGGKVDWIESCWNCQMPQINLRQLMELHIFPMISESNRLILVMDKAHVAAKWQEKDNFFSMLRSWLENREGEWYKLRLILSLSISPSELITDYRQSLFNICQQVDMVDFDNKQIQALLTLYKLNWSIEDITALINNVGGHPSLVRSIMNEQAATKKHLKDLLDPDYRIINTHLQMFINIFKNEPELKVELQKFKNNNPIGLDLDICHKLAHLGILKKESGKYCIRYPIYKTLIN